MADAALLYVRQDQDVATRLTAALEAAGVSICRSASALDEVSPYTSIIAIFSSASVRSRVVMEAAERAHAENKLIAVYAALCPLPPAFNRLTLFDLSNGGDDQVVAQIVLQVQRMERARATDAQLRGAMKPAGSAAAVQTYAPPEPEPPPVEPPTYQRARLRPADVAETEYWEPPPVAPRRQAWRDEIAALRDRQTIEPQPDYSPRSHLRPAFEPAAPHYEPEPDWRAEPEWAAPPEPEWSEPAHEPRRGNGMGVFLWTAAFAIAGFLIATQNELAPVRRALVEASEQVLVLAGMGPSKEALAEGAAIARDPPPR